MYHFFFNVQQLFLQYLSRLDVSCVYSLTKYVAFFAAVSYTDLKEKQVVLAKTGSARKKQRTSFSKTIL
jgi:hypothetical protein